MMRFGFPVIVLVAIIFATFLSVRQRTAAAESTLVTTGAARTPVLIELFTSEGCSSCPPADTLLEKLDRSQPVNSANVVVLSEHVDYWDDIGWKDPHSSRQFSIRQEDYARRFRREAYTPQMVVDGKMELVGSDGRGAIEAIGNASKVGKIPVILSSVRLEDNHTLAAHVEVGPVVSPESSSSGQVWIALADDVDHSNVIRGENAGRLLTHVAVVRSLTQAGTLDRGTFSKDVRQNIEGTDPKNLRVIVFVQESGAGSVLGVAAARLSN